MPQLQLPFFPEDITLINQNIGFMRKDSALTYLYGNLPVFTHDIDDMPSFRMFTSQLYINGSASQAEICRAFGVSKISVMRSVKLYRAKGIAGFFAPRNCRGPAVLTPAVLEQVQERLDGDMPIPEIAEELGLKADTLHKAIRSGKVRKPQKKELNPPPTDGSSKSERSKIDAVAPIGMGATNTAGRLLASIFHCGPTPPAFVCSLDVPNGGVLLGLPGLLSMGLLAHTEYFAFPEGYYRLDFSLKNSSLSAITP